MFHAQVHVPYVGLPAHRQLYEAEGGYTEDEMDYCADLTSLDAAIGRLRALLRSHGVAENTIVAFSGGDNGPEHFAVAEPQSQPLRWVEQHAWSSVVDGVQLRGRKRDLGEGGIRQAGLIEWPAIIKGNHISDYPVRITDYLPTLLDLHDITPPKGRKHVWPIDGTSLVPMLEAQGRMERSSEHALGWVTGHFASQAMTGLPVSSCDEGNCPLTRYDHGRITRSVRPYVPSLTHSRATCSAR
jgi:arylsulfatase A-like enzyme